MRGALIAAVVLGFAVVVGGSDAATATYGTAEATVAIVDGKAFGSASVRREGSDTATEALSKDRVTVGEGTATASAAGEEGSASAVVRDVELLGGRVTARSVVREADAEGIEGEVIGLRVDGRRYGPIRQHRVLRLGIGIRLVLNAGPAGLRLVTPDLDARLAIVDVGTFTRELPDPTRTPKPGRTPGSKEKARPSSTPEAPPTPPRLTAGGYAFPVVGEVTFTNDWGAPRASTGTHVGNDIFGEFGAPAIAVRDGRLTKVGTLEISGNRLWLIDDNGDAYFYAHLASFANAARNGARVQAGDVLGFIGNTGDAEPTPPHLHFEVHPGGIDEDPVNPYPILQAWQRREDVPPAAWAQRLGADAAERPGALVTVRDFIAE